MTTACSTIREMLDIPEELRAPEESTILKSHMAGCSECAALEQQLSGALALFRGDDILDVAPSLEAFLGKFHALDLEEKHLEAARGFTGEHLVTPKPSRPRWGLMEQLKSLGDWFSGLGWAPGAALALGLALLVIPNALKKQQEGSGVAGDGQTLPGADSVVPYASTRTKGAAGAANTAASPSVDLSAVIERAGKQGGVDLEVAENDSVLFPGDGLVFTFAIEASDRVVLIERTPEHQLNVIYRREGLVQGHQGSVTHMLTGDDGQVKRYVPTGAAGEYTYLAVVGSESHLASPAEVDSLWDRFVSQQLKPLDAGGSAHSLSVDALSVIVKSPSRVPSGR